MYFEKLDILVRETFLDTICLFFFFFVLVCRKIQYFGSKLTYLGWTDSPQLEMLDKCLFSKVTGLFFAFQFCLFI